MTTRASTIEVVTRALDDLHAVHDRTGAVQWFDDDRALLDATAVDAAGSAIPTSPLRGLPITVKDWIDVAGFPCAGESAEHADRRPAIDATGVARLRAAGAVVLAKTKPWNGVDPGAAPVAHPLDPARTPGGSSTGDAVVTGAGAVALGVGSDSGGSVRLPAAWCGVLGFKPTTGSIPSTGHFPRVGAWSDGRTTIGFLSSQLSLIDAARRTCVGPDRLDGGVAPVPIRRADAGDLASHLVAILPPDPEFPATEPIVAATTDALATLVGAGMVCCEWTWPWVADALELTERYWQRTALTGAQVEQQLWDWDRFRRRYLATDVDLLIAPVAPIVAPAQRPIRTDDFVFTLPASLTGSPAISVPAGADPITGMPLAVQVIGRPWDDHLVIAAAEVLRARFA